MLLALRSLRVRVSQEIAEQLWKHIARIHHPCLVLRRILPIGAAAAKVRCRAGEPHSARPALCAWPPCLAGPAVLHVMNVALVWIWHCSSAPLRRRQSGKSRWDAERVPLVVILVVVVAAQELRFGLGARVAVRINLECG